MTSPSPRNRTLTLSPDEATALKSRVATFDDIRRGEFLNRTICADLLEVLPLLPDGFADLIVCDPPYNLSKDFGAAKFREMSREAYDKYLMSWLPQVVAKLKATGSIYVCGDWRCSSALQDAIEKCGLSILSRITWQREKGRGAAKNWKNAMEDIWFAVKNPRDYFFNVEAVKLKRRVVAPYRKNGIPKDWAETADGNFRLTHPSNFWDDITIPFWSMAENTAHPTQKSEKLYAKLILASSKAGDVVFDPFLGSGTASVVAKKLGRRYCGVELNPEYCLWAEKRLEMAERDKSIQGFSDGVFWERNSLNLQKKSYDCARNCVYRIFAASFGRGSLIKIRVKREEILGAIHKGIREWRQG